MKKRILKKAMCCLAVAGTLFPWFDYKETVAYAEQQYINDVEETLNSLSLHEKICQMFVSYQYTLPKADGSGKVGATDTGETLRKSLEKYPVGGILYDASSMKTHTQLQNLLSAGQSYSKIPLIACVDEEGGRVARIAKTFGSYKYPEHAPFNDMLDYENEGTETAFKNAEIIGQNIKHYGFNLDYAPVADTHSNPANPIINRRAYSTSFDTGAELVGAAVDGYHSAGVGTTLKHFPGHGDTSSDTHLSGVVLYKSVNELRQNELKPFRAGIQSGSDAVMIAHIIVDEIGQESLFSSLILKDLLQEEMGYEGIITTDGLGMNAVKDHYSSAEIALRSIDAGIDMFCCIDNLPEAVDAIEQAVLDGRISEERIDESVRKILTFKQKHQ